jgi:AraC-like DNA-binding protein
LNQPADDRLDAILRRLLEEGETSQKRIAESLGDNDVASFARAFRNAVGTAPGAYRDRHRGKGISPADAPTEDGTGQQKHRRPGCERENAAISSSVR